ncbi:SDR family oxidoreductase [Kitasatospora gansuensis]
MNEQQRVLVVGANGTVGRHVVTGLLTGGTEVLALTRDPARAAQLPDGARLVPGDLSAARTLAAAAGQADAVFLAWPLHTAEGAAEALAALTGNARRVVYLSSAAVRDVPGQEPESPGRPDAAIESLIAGSGLRHTFLRPHGFMANALRWAAEIRTSGVVRGYGGAAGLTLVDERDIAAVAVRALTEEGHDGARYALTGPASPTQAEQVRIIGEAVGHPGGRRSPGGCPSADGRQRVAARDRGRRTRLRRGPDRRTGAGHRHRPGRHRHSRPHAARLGPRPRRAVSLTSTHPAR